MRRRRALVAALAATPMGFGAAAQAAPPPDAQTPRGTALASASAWYDALGAHRAPRRPDPGPTERLIVSLDGLAAIMSTPDERPRAADRLEAAQRALEPQIISLGGRIVGRYQVVLNALAVEVPTGRADAVAALPGVRAVSPVGYLSPAAAAAGAAAGLPRAPTKRVARNADPAHIVVIDTAVDAGAPQLGGGIGPRFPIVAGVDLVDGDGDPTPARDAPAWEAHGTQMAGIILSTAELERLPAAQRPRLVVYRVVSPERVGGRDLPLALTDRVIGALERAADPNGDGRTGDRAEVVYLGLAGAFAGGGRDPLADALAAVERAGSVVVAPVGNDGATLSRLGSVGLPASAPSVLAVGATASDLTPPTVRLQVGVGPAPALLGPLPSLGPPSPPGDLPVIALAGPEGLSTGLSPDDYAQATARGVPIRGAVVLVERGGGTLVDRARVAAAAGAAAVIVWDRKGSGVFPSATAEGGPAISVIGVGASEGQALADLLAGAPGLTVRLASQPRVGAPEAIASFSSTGPTADGRIKPDVVATGVEVPGPWPRDAAGGAQGATATGTSAAAARVAAIIARVRIDRPDLGPARARAAVVGSARPLGEVSPQAQGAGRVAGAAIAPVALDPPVIVAIRRTSQTRVAAGIVDLSRRPGSYRLALLSNDGSPLLLGPRVRVGAGQRVSSTIELPPRRTGWSGRIAVVSAATGRILVTAPVVAVRPARRSRDAIGAPKISKAGGLTQAEVRIGVVQRSSTRIRTVTVGDVRVRLVPDDGSASLLIAGVRSEGDWVPGTYRFAISRRLPSGGQLPAGRYRLRVTGRTPGGSGASATSAAFVVK